MTHHRSTDHGDHDFADPDDREVRRRRRRPDRDRPPTRATRREDLEGPAPDTDGAAGPAEGPEPEPTWSTWPGAVHGPQPRPGWVVTDGGAVDTELGLLKTGKEADVHLVARAVPGTPGCLLAAKRYRDSDHRMFHRDAGYLEGRRVRRSRETRAMARRTDFGRELIAGQWALAEFEALGRLWELSRRHGGLRVPYPVQLRGTELMLEFVGSAGGVAAPRLAQLRPDTATLAGLWAQLVDALRALAAEGLAHGDLSPYNLLVHDGELVIIDLPQVVDVVANPQGPAFLARDVAVTAAWFLGRGLPPRLADADALAAELLALAL